MTEGSISTFTADHSALPDPAQPQPTTSTLSKTEATHYDRQLRVWGLAAQQKLSQSCLLFLEVDGILSELLKNLVLSGVGKIYIHHKTIARAGATAEANGTANGAVAPGPSPLVTPEDIETNFLLTPDDLGKNKVDCVVKAVQELNPLVKVEAVGVGGHGGKPRSGSVSSPSSSLATTLADPASPSGKIFQEATIVFDTACVSVSSTTASSASTTSAPSLVSSSSASKRKLQEATEISDLCRKHGKTHFLLAHSGIYGFCFYRCCETTAGDHASAPDGQSRTNHGDATFNDILTKYAQGAKDIKITNPVVQRFFQEFKSVKNLHRAGPEGNAQTNGKIESDHDGENHFSRCFQLPAPLVTVSAILGGVVAQEAIKVMTGKDKPLKNCILMDLSIMQCVIEELQIPKTQERLPNGNEMRNGTTAKRTAEQRDPTSSERRKDATSNGSGIAVAKKAKTDAVAIDLLSDSD
ncbi:unnamed protein product [Amoebophrya sp. A120]|nr:unnamed protein product [Amoebophrya sp. A120]|eukprot:GSA120T00006146001.1